MTRTPHYLLDANILSELVRHPADHEYARLRLHLEQAGTPIGPNDMLIAAHALATESILVTANKGEFSRVPGLTVENGLEAPPEF